MQVSVHWTLSNFSSNVHYITVLKMVISNSSTPSYNKAVLGSKQPASLLAKTKGTMANFGWMLSDFGHEIVAFWVKIRALVRPYLLVQSWIGFDLLLMNFFTRKTTKFPQIGFLVPC